MRTDALLDVQSLSILQFKCLNLKHLNVSDIAHQSNKMDRSRRSRSSSRVSYSEDETENAEKAVQDYHRQQGAFTLSQVSCLLYDTVNNCFFFRSVCCGSGFGRR